MALLFLLSASLARAGAVEDGAASFAKGDLDEAIAAWESASADGHEPSGVIAYNLGIAWYRKGDFPRSVAHFRGAAHHRPRDANVLHNLALARSAHLNNLRELRISRGRLGGNAVTALRDRFGAALALA